MEYKERENCFQIYKTYTKHIQNLYKTKTFFLQCFASKLFTTDNVLHKKRYKKHIYITSPYFSDFFQCFRCSAVRAINE